MGHDKVYIVESSDGQEFYFAIRATQSGIAVFVFPSEDTDEEGADAIVELDVETSSNDEIRVLARIWDDETKKKEDATHILTLIEKDLASD